MQAPVLVLGATGVVGRGIVQAAVEAGVPVLAVARDADGLAALAARHPEGAVLALAGSVADDTRSARLADRLRALDRPLAGVVAAVAGPATRGRVLDQPSEALCAQLRHDVQPHLAAARHLLPLLARDGRGGGYVLVGGPGNALPWAGYAHRSIAAAALRMLACALHDEALALGVRVQLLSVDAPVCTDRARRHLCPQWPTALDIGRQALALIPRRGDAHAVVRYDAPRDPRHPGVESAAPASPQETDSPAAPASARWLQDARALLQSVLPPPNPRQDTPR
ncbi:MAG: SDR family NAD(P)-dependent oxidoreductase [Lysobacteraceae bacterium]